MARPRTSKPKGRNCTKCGNDDWNRSGSCAVCQRRLTSKWKREFPAKVLVDSARSRARRSGVPFDLTADDLVLPEYCPALGIPLRYGGGNGHNRPDSATLDRLIPDLGYTKGNVVVISDLANKIKTSATSEAILRVGAWLRDLGL